MGSRPPRQQPLPKKQRLAAADTEQQSNGLAMSTVTPVIGVITFPVAFAAAVIAYAASGNARTIGYAVVIAVIVAVSMWGLLRSQEGLRRRLQTTNELLAGIMVALLGFAFLIAGIAAIAAAWIVVGIVVLAGAAIIVRPALRDT